MRLLHASLITDHVRMVVLSRCAIHTQTNRPWSLRQCIDAYSAIGVKAVGVWRHTLQPAGAMKVLPAVVVSEVSLARRPAEADAAAGVPAVEEVLETLLVQAASRDAAAARRRRVMKPSRKPEVTERWRRASRRATFSASPPLMRR